MSQESLAKTSGVPKGTLDSWEQGRVAGFPKHPHLSGVYPALGVGDREQLVARAQAIDAAGKSENGGSPLVERVSRLEELLSRLLPQAQPVAPHFRWPMRPYLDEEDALATAAAGHETTGQQSDKAFLSGQRDLPYVTLASDATCMQPHLDPGDRVLFDPDALTQNGLPVVAYVVDDGLVVVKLYTRNGDIVTLSGVDDMKTAPIVRHASLVQVEGVVVDRVQRVTVRRR